jgi:hypothetical protein
MDPRRTGGDSIESLFKRSIFRSLESGLCERKTYRRDVLCCLLLSEHQAVVNSDRPHMGTRWPILSTTTKHDTKNGRAPDDRVTNQRVLLRSIQ